MAKYRMVRTEIWRNPMVMEELSPEDKYFYLYLLTNPNTTQIGIYRITKKQMAFDLGYSIETIQALMERFIEHHKLIRYNPETRELAIKNWGKENLDKVGKLVKDCIAAELKEVEDHSLIQYVAESIRKQEIRSLYDSFYQQEDMLVGEEEGCHVENSTYITESVEEENSFPPCSAVQEQKDMQTTIPFIVECHQAIKNPLDQRSEDTKEIIEFWDGNGFGLTNVNAKEQLLSWLGDSSFLEP